MECKYCKGRCIKKGLYKGSLKYQCKSCRAFQRSFYCQRDYNTVMQQQVALLNNEGMSISSIGRILQMPKSSVQLVLVRAAQKVTSPQITEANQVYEIDELHTFSRHDKPCYIIYAINRKKSNPGLWRYAKDGGLFVTFMLSPLDAGAGVTDDQF